MHGPFTDYLFTNWPTSWDTFGPLTLYMVDRDFVYDPADVHVGDIADLADHTICTFTLTDLGHIDYPSITNDTGYSDTIFYNSDLVSGGGLVVGALIVDNINNVLVWSDKDDGLISPMLFHDGDTPGLTPQSIDAHQIVVVKSTTGTWSMETTGGVSIGLTNELTNQFIAGWPDTWTAADPITVYFLDYAFIYNPLDANVSDVTDLADHTVMTWTMTGLATTSDDNGDIGTITPPATFVSLNPSGGATWQVIVAGTDGTILASSFAMNPSTYAGSDTPTVAVTGDGITDGALVNDTAQVLFGFDLGGGALAAITYAWDGDFDPTLTDTDVPVTVAVDGGQRGDTAPTGTVDILIDGVAYLSAVALTVLGADSIPDVSTTDSVNIQFATAGDHVVSFSYSGDENYPAVVSDDKDNVTVTVTAPEPVPTTTTIVYSGVRAVTVGQMVTGVEAHVLPDTATGTVHLLIDGSPVGSDVALTDGVATIPDFSFASGGEHTISATYSGDDADDESTSPTMTFRVLLPVGPRQLLYTKRYTVPGTAAPGPTPPSVIEGGFGMSWKDPFSDVGSGEMSVAFGQPTDLLTPCNWVGFVLDDGVNPPVDAATMVIETINDGKIAVGEEATLGYQVQGRTHICEWERMILQPEEGPNIRPISNTRYFNLSAKDLDESAYTPSVLPYTPGGVLASPWGPPKDYPDGFASFTFSRLWERVSTSTPDTFDRASGDNVALFTTPPGKCYVRKHITLASAADVAIYVSCDDYFELWVDNRPMLTGDPEPAGNYADTYERVTHLVEGDHIISFMVQNYDPGFSAGNICGLLCTIFALTSIDEHIGAGDYITHTGLVFDTDDVTLINDGWLWLDYPAAPPGFTPGRMVRVWHDEAVTRGCAPWTLDFSDTVDSAGNPWSIAPAYSFPIGQDGLTMLRGIADTDVDWHAVPGQRKLQMWNKGGKGVDSSASIILAKGVDLTASSYTTKV